jgi:hypothetical protein
MYDAFVAEKYADKKGNGRARFTRIGVAFDSDKGGFDLKLPAGIAVTGTVHIRPRRERAGSNEGPEDTGDDFLE